MFSNFLANTHGDKQIRNIFYLRFIKKMNTHNATCIHFYDQKKSFSRNTKLNIWYVKRLYYKFFFCILKYHVLYSK